MMVLSPQGWSSSPELAGNGGKGTLPAPLPPGVGEHRLGGESTLQLSEGFQPHLGRTPAFQGQSLRVSSVRGAEI